MAGAEAEALLGALEDLRSALTEAGHALPSFETLACGRGAIAPPAAPTVIVTSLAWEMGADEKQLAAVEERLRREFAALARSPHARLFLCTLFRRIDSSIRPGDRGAAMEQLERIRRLDLLAAELSHDFGLNIIDFDRAFTDVGGHVLGTDFRLRGPEALALARRVILSTLLAAGLDEILAPETQDAIRAIIERRGRDSDAAARSAFSADRLGFGEAFGAPRPQRYIAVSPQQRTIRTVFSNWRAGYVTSAETLRIVKRGIRGRLRRRRRY